MGDYDADYKLVVRCVKVNFTIIKIQVIREINY